MDERATGIDRGKTAALRAIAAAGLGGPDRKAHPILHWAHAEAVDISTAWRMRYSMPPNDPRFLEATEEDIVRDCLVIHYYDANLEAARSPASAAVAELAEKTEVAEKFVARAKKFLDDEGTKRAIQRAIKGGTPEELEQKRAPRTITIGGNFVAGRRVAP